MSTIKLLTAYIIAYFLLLLKRRESRDCENTLRFAVTGYCILYLI